MKIVMTLLVRNEEDTLRANLEFHRAQGVDLVIATDHLSTDATTGILKSYERAGFVHYIRQDSPTFEQSAWVTHMARLAYERYRATWVINNDADEFWWPRRGTLRTVLSRIPPVCTVARAGRHNFVPVDEAAGPFYEHMIYRETRSLNPVGRPLLPKVCHRGSARVVVGFGNHRARNIRTLWIWKAALDIFHYPMRTYAQFERRTREMGEILAADSARPPGVSNAREEMYRLYREGRLPEHYRQRLVPAAGVPAALADGRLVRDTRLADYMRRLNLSLAGDDLHGRPR